MIYEYTVTVDGREQRCAASYTVAADGTSDTQAVGLVGSWPPTRRACDVAFKAASERWDTIKADGNFADIIAASIDDDAECPCCAADHP